MRACVGAFRTLGSTLLAVAEVLGTCRSALPLPATLWRENCFALYFPCSVIPAIRWRVLGNARLPA